MEQSIARKQNIKIMWVMGQGGYGYRYSESQWHWNGLHKDLTAQFE